MWTVDSAVLLLAAGLLVKSSGACAGQVCVRMPGLTSAGIQSRSDPKVYVVQLRGRSQLPTARGARPGQWCGALLAQLRARLVLVLAPGTLHARRLRYGARTA